MINKKQLQRRHLILVVDDQEINRDVLGVILEDDYEVIYASDGAEALDIMQKHFRELSLILLDLIMPGMNGIEVLKRVRKDEHLKQIPIIVLTADKSAELEALELGAADFITKPFDVSEIILARVERIIELSDGRQLISAAEHDRLTGLYSRNFFYEYARQIYKSHPDKPMDAITVNVEQFHNINAFHGREFGDEVLRCIGDEIRGFLGKVDGIASRFQADRFYIYCSSQDDYRPLFDRMQTKINRISENVSIHLRMGVMPWQRGVEPLQLVDRSNAACNMVRGDYQNPLKVYNEEMLTKELYNHRLLNDIQTAISEKQFIVYYQPKYDIQTDPPRLKSAEALVRWKHPELGMISPADFIPLFEGNGLISIVDNYVWQEAAKQVGDWKKKYQYKVPISVNLSRTDIFDLTLIERLKELIVENGLSFHDIKLEVTESAYTDDARSLLDVIHRLREMGFEIEMDDFGSGYSSLNMLSEMPIDVLKMDMKFIRHIEESETDMKLVALILDIASYLNLKVVAEGVETEKQMNMLKQAGCDLVQGYYFSRPVPAEQFEELIKRELKIKEVGQ